MQQEILIGLTAILVFGLIAQWLSWRFAIPSILPLLIFGFIAGPVTGILKPDEAFGNVLFPLVSVSVAIILFEGGANLKLQELKSVGTVFRNLVTIGIIITWVLASAAGYYILNLPFYLAVLLGAILVVTGPTVILPILRNVRPVGQLGAVLKWEGIINDPIGALLAILVFEVIVAGGPGEATLKVTTSIIKTVVFSSAAGIAGSLFMIVLLKRKLVPDFLQNTLSVSLVIFVYTVSNVIQQESGLFAVTIMGVILANQKKVSIRHLIEFKEVLRTILLSFLFMVLAARIELSSFKQLGWESAGFIAALILIIRPAAVIASSFNSSLSLKEKIYLAFMAPRGVVAAAVASIFSIELLNTGHPEAEILVPVMFLVIIATITIYGLGAMPFAKMLKIADADPQGLLILGAHPFARAIGKTLKQNGIKVLLVDTNRENTRAAKMENLPVYTGSILAEGILDELDLTGIGKFIALTPNKEVNSLAVLHFSKLFSSSGVYQVNSEEEMRKSEVTRELKGRVLFSPEITPGLFENFNEEGLRVTPLTARFSFDSLISQNNNEKIIPLFLITENRKLLIYSTDEQPKSRAGQTIISLSLIEQVQAAP